MESGIASRLMPGSVVRVTQQIAARDHTWTTDVSGTVVEFSQRQTGSWYAHSKNDRLWLDRLTLAKADGELITLNLDEYSHVEVLDTAAAHTAPGNSAKAHETDLPA